MENNIENKAKFFALYFGQKFVHTGEGRPIKALGNEIVMNYENSDKFQLCCYSNQRAVELKPLSLINEDDLDILGWSISEVKDIEKECYISGYETDYLRSQGYAVQWYDLSVEEQVSRGWVKLKEN